LLLPGDVPPLPAGLEIRNVRVKLDADTRFIAHLQLHHVTAIQNQSRASRLGCEFMHVQPQAQRALQRYIDQTQKRRRLLSLD
jgi:c-di-GMP-binding flagellar brake protein YcgR